ncbi:MAG: asparagine synthase-related protein [Limisphaerales bacterium]
MSDFLLSFDSAPQQAPLLRLLQQPYGDHQPAGRVLPLPLGGALGVLEDKIAHGRNLLSRGNLTLAWVGDLVSPPGHSLEKAFNRLAPAVRPEELKDTLQNSGLLESLGGGFAAILVSDQCVALITDPLASVQVYIGSTPDGQIVAAGTHADLVAAVTGVDAIDPASVCDFMNVGIACCPYTIHRHVRELAPGTVALFSRQPDRAIRCQEFQYWVPPSELTGRIDQEELTREFLARWKNAVHARCDGDLLGIQLSGGLDSRMVMATIPREKTAVGLTLCDQINREARIARTVAQCYNREWRTLQRDPEYLGRTALDSIRLMGCEGEWQHAHCLGFAESIRSMGVDTVFSGLYMDNNFKGYYAKDIVRIGRLGGLLPAVYKTVSLDYSDQISPFCGEKVKTDFLDESLARRKRFYAGHFARNRSSQWEWLDGYPNSQASDNTGWVAERRVMRLRLPVMDRPLVELSFQIPATMKADGQFFEQAAARALGPGCRIPNANDGVRPGSSHWSRLAQRTIRKLQNKKRTTLARLGVKVEVPHSWHDFQTYWRESAALDQLRRDHGDNLQDFREVFKQDPLPQLHDKNLNCQFGYRFLQLAVWRSVMKQYRDVAAGRSL